MPDAEKLGRGFTVFCSVKLKQMSRDVAKHFTTVVRDIPKVAECYNVSIGSILSAFVMDEIKNTRAIYL